MNAAQLRSVLRIAVAAALLSPVVGRAAPAPETPPEKNTANSRALARILSPDFATTPVAKVDAEVITAGQLADAMLAAHGEHHAGAKAGATDYRATLDRLVDVQLIVLEAREEGIDELPKVKAAIEKTEESKLKDILKGRELAKVKVDKASVDRAYELAVTEYRFHALSIPKEEDAKDVAVRVKKGKTFDEVARQMAAEQKAGDRGDGYVSADKLAPAIKAALDKAKPGGITAPVNVGGTWFVALFIEKRRKDDPKVRESVEETILAGKREEALTSYYQALAKKHAKIDKKLLHSLDYEAAKPGVEALAKDGRVLARIDSGKVVTVASFTSELDKQFFHGVEDAARQKRANQRIQVVFDSMMFRYLLVDEANRQKLRDTDEYKKAVKESTDRLLFGAFLENAILPTLQVTEAEGKKYYEDHKAEFTTPAMVRLDGLAFAQVKDAQAAAQKLKAGTDFKWMAQNADGLVPADKVSFQFEAAPVMVGSLPEGLAKALSGAREGDYRLWAASDREAYVVRLLKEIPASPQPFAEVQESIQKKLFSDKVGPAVKDWADKLRKHHDVQLYLTKLGE